jgi:LysM repeat protein
MILGVLVLPNSANANFLTNLLNREVSAKEEVLDTTNSQNIGLLEANVSSLSILNKKEGSKEESTLNITNDALLPAVGPLTPSGETEDDSSFSYQEISIYVVRPGDNVNDIAKMFDVSVNTILWANDMKKGDKLKTGDTLIILPVDGVKHVVKKGDTIKNIAKTYGVEARDIYEFNALDEKSLLVIGEEIIIPGAEIKEQPKPTSTAKKPSSNNKPTGQTNLNKNIQGGVIPNNFRIADNSTPLPGYFIKPVEGPRCRLTQGKHDRYAIDIGCPTGTPIYASASGKVIFSKVGWNGAFGNLVIIAHPNGTQTFYAHQSKIAASLGDQVKQGEIIGYVGNTGRSTGPHIHFEVRGAKNPGFDNSWAR